MTKSDHKQAGFSIVETLLVLVVLAALAFVGYTFAGKQKTASQQASVSTSTQQDKVADSSGKEAETAASTASSSSNTVKTDVLKAVDIDNGETADTSTGGTTDEEN